MCQPRNGKLRETSTTSTLLLCDSKLKQKLKKIICKSPFPHLCRFIIGVPGRALFINIYVCHFYIVNCSPLYTAPSSVIQRVILHWSTLITSFDLLYPTFTTSFITDQQCTDCSVQTHPISQQHIAMPLLFKTHCNASSSALDCWSTVHHQYATLHSALSLVSQDNLLH